MPSLAIPNGLKPVVSNYSFDEPGGVLRTEVAGGMPRYGLDWDRGSQRFTVTLLLDALEFAVWTAFYHHVIKKGALAFDMQLDSGFGAQQHSVNIVPGSYSTARSGGVMMVVSFTVEAESAVYAMSATDAQNMVDVYNTYGAYTTKFLDRLVQFANHDANVLDF